MDITAEYVQQVLMNSAGIEISLDEAAELVPLVRGQRAALARLDRFDVSFVRPCLDGDPRSAYL
jgi:hypothetical protein